MTSNGSTRTPDITTNGLRPLVSNQDSQHAESNADVNQKLSAARTRLILDKPFLGALVLRLPLVENSQWCKTTATDARAIYYNQTYLSELSLSQVQFVLAHEALHCGLSHFARREHREQKRWDVACDHAVNQLLAADNLEPPPTALFDASYAGMSAEEIYPCIETDDNEEPMDQHLYDPQLSDNNTLNNNNPADQQTSAPESSSSNDSSDNSSDVETQIHNSPPPPLNSTERDRLDTKWQQRLAGAAQQAEQAGKLNDSIARMLQRLLQPSVPWRSMLSRFMSSAARIDYNLTRPSQRREGDAILPSLHTRQIDVAVAIDTSGSIRQEELDVFLTELNAIKGSMNARITLLACDAELDKNCPWIFEPWDPMKFPPQLSGGGTTDFNPVFDWLTASIMRPDLLIYFTDGKGHFPDTPPSLPVLWLVKGGAAVPWGQRIQLN